MLQLYLLSESFSDMAFSALKAFPSSCFPLAFFPPRWSLMPTLWHCCPGLVLTQAQTLEGCSVFVLPSSLHKLHRARQSWAPWWGPHRIRAHEVDRRLCQMELYFFIFCKNVNPLNVFSFSLAFNLRSICLRCSFLFTLWFFYCFFIYLCIDWLIYILVLLLTFSHLPPVGNPIHSTNVTSPEMSSLVFLISTH